MTTERKAIRLFPTNYDARGVLSFWYILPTRSLRDLVHRRLLQKHPELNYVVYWKDRYGYGLEMTVADWVNPGQVYFNR